MLKTIIFTCCLLQQIALSANIVLYLIGLKLWQRLDRQKKKISTAIDGGNEENWTRMQSNPSSHLSTNITKYYFNSME